MTSTAGDAAADLARRGLAAALAHHWHPVCAEAELPGPVGVQLLGRELVVARLRSGEVVAMADRCPHRSTRLSVGCVDEAGLRCAYHGWAYGADGRCTEIPSLPDGPIPPAAAVPAAEAQVAHGLVWVRLDSRVATPLPPCPMLDDPSMRVVVGGPYTWPVSALRRVENFVDLAHFAFVHDGSLGRRDQPVPDLPTIERVGAELRFRYDPPLPDDRQATAMLGSSAYRMPVPCTVDIAFVLPDGARRRLWMTASPIDEGTCRCFWSIGRSDDVEPEHDAAHLAFQAQVLDEDEAVVTHQVPRALPLEPGAEVSVRTDRVSLAYRRWLRELAAAALDGPDAYAAALGLHDVAATEARAAG